MYLSQSHSTDRPAEIYVYPQRDDDFQVQVFFGTASHSLYMTLDEARKFASDLLAALPS
jgi:hypothetical protein